MDKEIRLASFEVEERGEGQAPKFKGYAAVFDAEANIGGMFIEKIERGAFAHALTNSDIHAVYNHDSNFVLGRNKSGTLVLSEDEKGLYVEIDPPNTSQARDIMELVKRGDVDQMSFAFSMQGGAETWDDTGEDLPVRTIHKFGELFDVTITPRGAYSQTSIGLRSFEDFKKGQRQKNFNAAQSRIAKKKYLAERLQEKSNAKA